GMVTAGILTAPELAEIHAAGDAMAELRPDEAYAQAEAVAAVEADREARAARKAQKQAEAEARRRARAEAVAHRRATDIIYLGREVSAGLGDRRSHIEKLRGAGLPVLTDPASVATAMGMSIPRLRWLAFHSEAPTRTHYVR